MDAEGDEHPIGFFSHKLLPWEQRYLTVEKGCLAIKLGVQAFRVYLLGRHQPYQFRVEYCAGKVNSNADALTWENCLTPNMTILSLEKEGGVSGTLTLPYLVFA